MSHALAEAVKRADGKAILVGYSGGLDSSVLLHLLAHDPDARACGLRAVHVHHGLHPDADAWAAHCRQSCATLGVDLVVVQVEVNRAAGLGIEGAARVARHAAFAETLATGEILALAHHRDDQAETFLLRALRASGTDGLASMRPWRAYSRGWLWRPLLNLPRATLLAHARSHRIPWIEDPGNASLAFDRNFLRQQVLPVLGERWPQVAQAFANCAALCADASDLLAAADAAALHAAAIADDTLDTASLRALPRPQRARLLRHWIAGLGLPALPARGIDAIERHLLGARADAAACFDWADARVQRWRDRLHAGRRRDPWPTGWSRQWDGSAAIALPGGATLALVGVPAFDVAVRVHARQGGERIVLPARRHSHALKHVLQQAAIPPWQRIGMPLLSASDGDVLAAGDAIVSARLDAWLRQHDARLRWTRVA